MRRGDPRNGRPYRRHRDRMRGEQPCAYCSELIDDSLRWPHPLSRVVAHDRAIALGGDATDPANSWPAHKRCNERGGTRPISQPLDRRPW